MDIHLTDTDGGREQEDSTDLDVWTKQPVKGENGNHFLIVSKASLWGDDIYKILITSYSYCKFPMYLSLC